MVWFLWFMVAVVLGLGAVVASGRWGELPTTQRDAPYPALPEGDLTAADIAAVQFDVTFRGYSMTQVDELLSRVQRQLGGLPALEPVWDGQSVPSAIMAPEESLQEPKEGEPWQQ